MKKLIRLHRTDKVEEIPTYYEELVNKESNIETHIESLLLSTDILSYDEKSELYFDYNEFCKEKINIEVIDVNKSLWLIETGEYGYDMYDSGVFCAYTEKEALDIAINKHDSFLSSTIKRIGTAENNLEVGIICLSFNAG